MNKSAQIGCFVLVLVLIGLLVGGGIFYFTQVPSMDEVLPPNATPLIVTLTAPSNGTAVPMNAFTTIEANASAVKPIVALELWIDGNPAQAKSPPANATQASAFWTWTPASEGEHILLVRARDADGRIATSNIARVNAGKSANVVVEDPYKPKPGDTIGSVADKFKVPPQAIIDLNPQVNPSSPLPPDQPINVPVPIPPQPPGEDNPAPDSGGTQPQGNSGDAPDPNNSKPAPPPPNLPFLSICAKFPAICNALTQPAAPKIIALAGQTCEANLFVADKSTNEAGFFIYRLAPGEVAFQRIATLGEANGGSFKFTDADLYGNFQYYVSSFNASGESPSNIVQVTINKSNCLTPNWMSLQLQGAKLKVSQPVDKVYCYLSVNGGTWKRIPAFGYILPKNGEFDLSKFLNTLMTPPPKNDITLELECWGWQGAALFNLGKVKETIKAGGTLNPNFIITGANWQLLAKLLQGYNPTIPNPGNPPPPPPPAPTPPPGNSPKQKIAPPYKVRVTSDPKECVSHLGDGLSQLFLALACDAAIKSGDVVLVWEWDQYGSAFPCGANQPCAWIANIDGYHIYRLLKDSKGNLDTYHLEFTVTPKEMKMHGVKFIPPDPILDDINCYAVTAFKGNIESDWIDPMPCPAAPAPPTGQPQPAPGPTTVKLSPSNWGTSWQAKYYGCGGLFGGLQAGGLAPDLPNSSLGQILAGYQRLTNTSGCDAIAYIYRGAVRFDLNFLAGKQVSNATLKFKSNDSEIGNEQVGYSKPAYCSRSLRYATVDWTPANWQGWYEGKLYKFLLDKKSVNVTTMVNQWASGAQTNLGFIFVGFDEEMPQDSNANACWNRWSDFSLDVTYVP